MKTTTGGGCNQSLQQWAFVEVRQQQDHANYLRLCLSTASNMLRLMATNLYYPQQYVDRRTDNLQSCCFSPTKGPALRWLTLQTMVQQQV